MLSSRSGYTRIATHCLPFTKTSTTLLSMNTRNSRISSASIRTGAVSGALDRTSGAPDEYDESIVIRLVRNSDLRPRRALIDDSYEWKVSRNPRFRKNAIRVNSSFWGARSTFSSTMGASFGSISATISIALPWMPSSTTSRRRAGHSVGVNGNLLSLPVSLNVK